jgi:hypothetical protein
VKMHVQREALWDFKGKIAFLAKRSWGPAMVVVCTGCAPQVRPMAFEVATLVAEAGGLYEPVAGVLAERGFSPLTPGAMVNRNPRARRACASRSRGALRFTGLTWCACAMAA